jgi:hypothetical protein
MVYRPVSGLESDWCCQLAHAARRPHVREELVEDLDDAVGVLGPQEQGVDHDGVVQLGATGAQDRLAVEQRLAGLLLDRGPCQLAGRHIDTDCPAFLLMGRRQFGAL